LGIQDPVRAEYVLVGAAITRKVADTREPNQAPNLPGVQLEGFHAIHIVLRLLSGIRPGLCPFARGDRNSDL
jgi:hypothetical protein